MASSLPSQRTVNADVPEIKIFSSRFVYNFFEPDERTNDTGLTAPEFIRTRPAEGFDSEFIESDNFNRFASRFVRLEWKPFFETEDFAPANLRIFDNMKKVYNEQDFTAENFTPMALQDTGLDGKLNFFIKKLIEQQRDLAKAEAQDTTLQESPLDTVKDTLGRTSNQVNESMICESLIDMEEEGYFFFDDAGEKVKSESLINDLVNVKTNLQMNNRFMFDILEKSSQDAYKINIFEDEQEELLDFALTVKRDAESLKNPNILDGRDYDVEIQEYIDFTVIDPNSYEPRKQILGYIIDKTELTDAGVVKQHDPIIVESPNVNTTVDIRVKYGSTYTYTIRAIAYVEMQAEDIESGEIGVLTFLLSSKPSKLQEVECIEQTPPPPPADFNVRWDVTRKSAVLEWCFPVNPQRDIKQWQIFRRSSIEEPFELQKVYNFDDSVIKEDEDFSEFPSTELVEELSSPKNFYVDPEFDKGSKFIYSVCSVDARGLSSNYSMQVEITFDRFKNKLNKKLISVAGAPKAYPNLLLNSDTFVDTIRDSGHQSMRITFNPEYLKVTNSADDDLKLLKTDADSHYKMNLINTDLQEQKNITINVIDARRSPEKEPPEAPRTKPERKFGVRKATTARER